MSSDILLCTQREQFEHNVYIGFEDKNIDVVLSISQLK